MTFIRLLFLVICGTVCVKSSCINSPNDPCLSANYKEINEYSRSTTYFNPSGNFITDATLVQGWYRSTSPAGGDIPTSAPQIGHCQAYTPMWVDGALPSVADGIVQRRVCGVGMSNNCSSVINICIKNCVNYNVYYLYRPAGSYERYCFGNELQCPSGQTSPNGYTPGCQAMALDNNPVISFNVQTSTVSNTTCQVNAVYNCNVNSSNSLQLEVQWFVSGNIIKTENKTTSTLPAQLTTTELKNAGVNQYGFNLKCQMQPRLSATGQLTGYAKFTEQTIEFSTIKSQIQPTSAQDAIQVPPNTIVPIEYTYACSSSSTTTSASNGKKGPHCCKDKDDGNLPLKIGLSVVGGISAIVFIVIAVFLYVSHRGDRKTTRVQDSTVSLNNQYMNGPVVMTPPEYYEIDPYNEKKIRVPTPVESTGYGKMNYGNDKHKI